MEKNSGVSVGSLTQMVDEKLEANERLALWLWLGVIGGLASQGRRCRPEWEVPVEGIKRVMPEIPEFICCNGGAGISGLVYLVSPKFQKCAADPHC